MQLVAGAVVADRFRLIRELGRGAMGAVWLATHEGLGLPCAVKFMHGRVLDRPVARERFEREAKAAATLRSANVVQILDYGVWENAPYLAMEYLEGETLRERLERCERLTADETLRVVTQVGRALGRAHRLGIVHRDLKPENIFLVQDEEGVVAKVLDFGVAKDSGVLGAAPGSTRTGVLLGTPTFMSPEQAKGAKEADWRSDLWALAVITYRCLVGALPFYREQLLDLLLLICTAPIPVPSEHASHLPKSFDAWWARATERDRERRFQSAREMIDALALALGSPATAEDAFVPEEEPPPAPLSCAVAALPAAATQPTASPVSGGTTADPVGAALADGAAGPSDGAAVQPRAGRWWLVGVGTAVLAALVGGGALLLSARHAARSALPVERDASAEPGPPPSPASTGPAPAADAVGRPPPEPAEGAIADAAGSTAAPAVQPAPSPTAAPGTATARAVPGTTTPSARSATAAARGTAAPAARPSASQGAPGRVGF